jgi:pyrimidine operon attenuation protein / uracil phosphoribosyltransferase
MLKNISMILLDSKHISRTIKRMSYQILEEAGDTSVCLVGINARGFALAGMFKEYLDEVTQNHTDIYRYQEKSKEPIVFKKPPSDNQILVIVDDVIFSGETIFNCFQIIPELSQFQKICVTVLADRGHRKFPILAGIVGLHVPTKLNEHVELLLDNHKPLELVLFKR